MSHREDCYLLYRENSYLMQPQFLKSNFYYIVLDFFLFLYFLSNMLWLLYDRSGVKIVGCLRCIIKTKNINISVDVDADIAKVYGLDRLSLICVYPSFVFFFGFCCSYQCCEMHMILLIVHVPLDHQFIHDFGSLSGILLLLVGIEWR